MLDQWETIQYINPVCPPIPSKIWRKAQKSIRPNVTKRGPLQWQKEGRYAPDIEGDITDHQDQFENDPKNRCMYGEELQQFHDEDNLLLGFSTPIHWKKRDRKKKYMSHKNIKNHSFDIIGLLEVNIH